MGEPCSAKCQNKRNNRCSLEDELIRQSRVEFGEEWDPLKHCERFIPLEDEELSEQGQRQGQQQQKKQFRKKP